jgi:hypothetical protein
MGGNFIHGEGKLINKKMIFLFVSNTYECSKKHTLLERDKFFRGESSGVYAL